MAAKKKPMGTLDAATLGLSAAALAPKTERRSMAPPPERPPVKLISGDPATQAKELIRLLHEEAKVI
jgi:electron transfer flavoprotein beta subunit